MPSSVPSGSPVSSAALYQRLSHLIPALKGLAILWIVLYHLWGYSRDYEFSRLSWPPSLTQGAEYILSVICMMGEHGVHIFLIASGFGLMASWWRRQQLRPVAMNQAEIWTFWRRRMSRILPLYGVAHVLVLGLVWINPAWVPQGELLLQGNLEAIALIILSLTTLRNFFIDYYFALNSAWWYVGLTVQLYLVFPFLVRLGQRWGWSRLLGGALATSLIYRTLIVVLPLNDKVTDIMLRGAFFPTRLFEFVVGMVLAIGLLSPLAVGTDQKSPLWLTGLRRLLSDPTMVPVAAGLWASGLLLDWLSPAQGMGLRIGADALIGVGELCCLVQALTWLPIVVPLLAVLGQYSYGIYLIHMNILRVAWAGLVQLLSSFWPRFAVVVLLCCLTGIWLEAGYGWLQQRHLARQPVR